MHRSAQGMAPGWHSWTPELDEMLMTGEVFMIEVEDDASSGPKRNGRHFLEDQTSLGDGPQAGTAGLPNWIKC